MIDLIMAAVDAPVEIIEVCFDCPVEDPKFSIVPHLEALLAAIMVAAPAMIFGIFLHRNFVTIPVFFRLLMVALCAPIFLFLFLLAMELAGSGLPFSRAIEAAWHSVFESDFFPLLPSMMVAAAISLFDARHAEAQASSTYFSEV